MLDWDTFWQVFVFGIECASFILLVVGLMLLPSLLGIWMSSTSFIVFLTCLSLMFAKKWIG